MNFPRILAALLLSVGLGFAYYYFDVIQSAEHEEARRISDRAIGITAGMVNSLTIDMDGKILSLKKVDDDWKIVEPIETDADNNAVELLLTSAEYMTIAGVVGAKKSMSMEDYGLDAPITISFGLTDGKVRPLIVGDKNPTGRDHYAIGKDVDKIVLVNQGRVAAITKNLFELRDKDLFHLETKDVTGLSMRLEKYIIRVKKDESGGWRLIEPINAKGDTKAIENIIGNLSALTFSGFIDEQGDDLPQYGLDNPFASLALTHGDADEATTLLIGKATGGGGFYAKLQDKKLVARVPASIMGSFPKKIASLRDRDLIPFAMDVIEKIEIDNDGAILAIKKTVGDGDDQKWLIVKPKESRVDAQAMMGLLFDIERAKATGFIDESRHTQADLGLDKPDATITVSTKADTHILKLSRAGEEGRGRYYARLDDEDAIYEVDSQTYKNLSRGYEHLRYKKIFDISTEDVGRIVVERLRQTFEVTRSNDNYNLVKPSRRKLKGDIYNRFVWTVLSLKYLNITQDVAKADMGFDKPSLMISVYNSEGKIVDKITIGSRAGGDKEFYLKGEKLDATYLINERFVTVEVINALEGLIGG